MLWCQDCTLLSRTSEIYAALGIFNCGPQFPWLKIARVLVHSLVLPSDLLGSCDASVTTCWLSGGPVAIAWSFIYFFCGVTAWLGQCQTTMRAAVSVSMLLEGVHFSCFQLLYPHTQVFFKGFKSFTRERTIGREALNYLDKWELIGTPARSHLPTTSDLVSVLWNPSNYLSLSICFP